MICAECETEIDRNANDLWIHEDDEQDDHEPRATVRDWEAEEQYEELLNEVYEPVNVCGYDYDAGRALRQLDPIAFRQGMLDYFDGEGIDIV